MMSTVTTLQFRSKPALALPDLLSQNMYKMSFTISQNMNIFRVLLPDARTCYNINLADGGIVSGRSLIIDDFVFRSTPSAKENHSAHRFTSSLGATP